MKSWSIFAWLKLFSVVLNERGVHVQLKSHVIQVSLDVDKTWTPPLDPPSRSPFWTPFWNPFSTSFWTPKFFQWKEFIIVNLSYTQYVCYIPQLLSQFIFLQFSVQLKRRSSLPRYTFPSSCLVFPTGIKNFLAVTYSDNFHRTCHFQVAWNPTISFSAVAVMCTPVICVSPHTYH